MTKAQVTCRTLGVLGLAIAGWAGPAPAAPQAEPETWESRTIRDTQGRLESCAIIREFDDGTILSFAVSRNRDFILMVSNPDLHLPIDWGGMVHYAVDDGLEYRAYAEGVGGSLIVDLPETASLQVMLGDGHWLYLGELGDRGYSLDGLKKGLWSLGNCVDRALAAEPGSAVKPKPAAPAPVPTVSTAAPAPASATPAPTPIETAGQVEVELGTYDSAETARADWPHLQRRFDPLLAGRQPLIHQRIRNRDGRVFHLLRVGGFPDRAAAERLCRALEAKKQECSVR